MAKNIKLGCDKNLQAKSKRKVGPAKVAGIDGAVKDETKETREKVLTGERGRQNTCKRTKKKYRIGTKYGHNFCQNKSSFRQVQVMSLIAEELNADSRDCK